MRERTEDLLTLRDGGPVDARVRARVADNEAAVAELGRLADMRERLRALPRLSPPPDAWARIEVGIAAHNAAPRAPRRGLAAGLAAAVLVTLGVLAALYARNGPSEKPPPFVAQDAGQPAPRETAAAGAADLGTLVRESARLERVLRRLPPQRRLVEAGTASTIAGLEQQIGLIDMQLTLESASGTDTPSRRALWQDRVDLMNALVYVRYSNAQPIGY